MACKMGIIAPVLYPKRCEVGVRGRGTRQGWVPTSTQVAGGGIQGGSRHQDQPDRVDVQAALLNDTTNEASVLGFPVAGNRLLQPLRNALRFFLVHMLAVVNCQMASSFPLTMICLSVNCQ